MASVQEVAKLQRQQADQAALISQLRHAEAAADRQCSKLTQVLQQQEQAHAELKAEVRGCTQHASGSAVGSFRSASHMVCTRQPQLWG